MNYRIILWLYGVMLSVVCPDSLAQEGLDLNQAIIRVLENHSGLKIADQEARAMAARLRQAVQPPADRVSMTLENFAGSGETVALRGLEATLSLSRTLERGNKAAHRGEVVQGEALVLRTDRDIDRLNLLAEATQRFLHVAADQERLNLIEQAIELVRQTQTTVEQHIRAGATPTVERHRIAIDLTSHEIELEHRLHELENARVRLASLWNARQADFGHAVADIFELNALPDFSELANLLDRNPELVRQLRTDDLARARISLMQSRGTPDIDVSAGLRYLGGSNDVAAMVWASIPLGSGSRALPAIEEAEALSRIEPLNLEQKRMELYATLFGLYQEMKHAKEAIARLNETTLPAARRMLEEYQNGYQAGRYSLLELIQAQQLLHATRTQLLEMAVSYHSRKIDIDRLTAAQLSQW